MNDRELGPRNSLDNGNRASYDTVDANRTYTPTDAQATEVIFDADRSVKPSRIPILRGKNLEGSSSDNDSTDKCAYSSLDDYERSRQLSPANIPTSPITGKKYRSPLSFQARLSDRSLKRQINNGNLSFDDNARNSPNGSIDSYGSSMMKTVGNESRDDYVKNSHGLLTFGVKNTVILQNENNSERSTPVSTFVDINAIDITKFDDSVSIDTTNSDRKPRFKWMFGQHKNVNVVCH